MTDKQQIIIDGIDISKCRYHRRCVLPDNIGCKIDDFLCCDKPNCNFKQLARKTQECEELKESNNKAQELYKYFMDVAENTASENKELENNLHIANTNYEAAEKESDRYRKALEEIENFTKKHCDYWCEHHRILDIINKAKGTGNGLS